MYLNRVELIGFLGNDAEVRNTNGGKAVTSLSVATKTTWKQDGERKERTEWHRISVWGKLGEYAAKLTKGAHVRIEGELRSREYDGKDGKVQTYEIVAESILNLNGGRSQGADDADGNDEEGRG